MGGRKTPVRTCVACRTAGGKKDFIRLVRTPEGPIVIDPSGKVPGRGAYICPTPECLATALKKKSIERGLRAPVPEQIIEELRAAVARGKGD